MLSAPHVVHRPAPAPSVLVLARPGPEGDDLFAELSRRPDLTLLRVATTAAARLAIEELPVALVVACPETAAGDIEAILAHRDAVRPGTPVLAIRTRRDESPEAWGARGVAILRMPLLPDVLSRSVDVVLGMRASKERGG